MSSKQREELAAQLGELSCASLVDAMGRLYPHRGHLLPLTSPSPTRPLFGTAATITYLPYRADLERAPDFAELFYRAVGSQPAGQVLVLSSGGHPEASHGGGTKLSRVQHQGLAGVLADGRLRDFTQLAGYGFATWCRGEATRWGGDVVMPYVTGQAVEVGGVCVLPGDYIYVDASGGVVIPAANVVELFAEAHRVETEDAQFADRICTENPASPHNGGM